MCTCVLHTETEPFIPVRSNMPPVSVPTNNASHSSPSHNPSPSQHILYQGGRKYSLYWTDPPFKMVDRKKTQKPKLITQKKITSSRSFFVSLFLSTHNWHTIGPLRLHNVPINVHDYSVSRSCEAPKTGKNVKYCQDTPYVGDSQHNECLVLVQLFGL